MNVTIFYKCKSPSGTSKDIFYNKIVAYEYDGDGEPASAEDVTIYAKVRIEACACGWCKAEYKKGLGIHIKCDKCGIHTNGFQGIKKTIREWNSIAQVSRVIRDL